MKDKFLSETRLSQVNNDGDLMFNGQITNYNINPIAIQANETASKNRLSITVKVNFINNIDKDNSFNKTFNRYTDYESSINFTSVEESLNEEIISQLIEDIFNEAFQIKNGEYIRIGLMNHSKLTVMMPLLSKN